MVPETVCPALLVCFILLYCTLENGHNGMMVCFPVSCIYLCAWWGLIICSVYMRGHIRVEGRSVQGVFLYHPLPLVLEAGSLMLPNSHQFGEAG